VEINMNRRSWLLVALMIGCGAGVATMTVTVPTKTYFCSANGRAELTLEGYEGEEAVIIPRGEQDPLTGAYPYTVPATSFEGIPSNTYTATVTLWLVGGTSLNGGVNSRPSAVLGTCTVVVDAENGVCVPTWSP
jgi:hypothetical protein